MWFRVNITEAVTVHSPDFGTRVNFEPERGWFPHVGFKVHVLEPGQPNGYYHRETSQEGCLVLAGECLALIEEEEIALTKGDFVHLGPGTAHIFVGSGSDRCVLALFGGRQPLPEFDYPVSAMAQARNAGAGQQTDDPRVAYRELSGWAPGDAPAEVPW